MCPKSSVFAWAWHKMKKGFIVLAASSYWTLFPSMNSCFSLMRILPSKHCTSRGYKIWLVLKFRRQGLPHTHTLEWWDSVVQKQLAWAFFLTLECFLNAYPRELICCCHFHLPPPLPSNAPLFHSLSFGRDEYGYTVTLNGEDWCIWQKVSAFIGLRPTLCWLFRARLGVLYSEKHPTECWSIQ